MDIKSVAVNQFLTLIYLKRIYSTVRSILCSCILGDSGVGPGGC